MRAFALLYDAIDSTTSTNAKVAAMVSYFTSAAPADAAWAVFFLTGRRLKRLLQYSLIHDWTMAATGIESWLLEECYAVVGDGAETAALILDQLPTTPEAPLSLAEWIEGRIMRLREMEPDRQRDAALAWFRSLDRLERFILLKLLTGEFRVGVSHTLVVRALAQAAALEPPVIAARLMGDWTPSPEWFTKVMSREHTADDHSKPYPFCLAAPLDTDPSTLGDPAGWQVEWKWDGIRAQLIRRGGSIHLWSRGEELITHRFPEISAAATHLPDGTVLDGEVLAFRDDRPLPFSALQQRIGRQKQVAQMARTVPVVFMAYDVLEMEGRDIRSVPLQERRRVLASIVGLPGGGPFSALIGPAEAGPDQAAPEAGPDRSAPESAAVIRPTGVLRASPLLESTSWDTLARERARSRELGVEGLMIKRLDSTYGVGRKRGEWWKWKIDPYSVDAVLIYAQPGSGKRASLLTDYTFGVWHEGQLIPFAKAYSGLSNDEIAEMDRWIRRHTIERFGPVRHVEPVQVFELGFEGIAESSRHKSGIAVRFPRMLRWRKDKKAEDADSLESVRALLTAVRGT